MEKNAVSFIAKGKQKAFDLAHRSTINFNIGKYNIAVSGGKSQFYDMDTARMMAKNLKWQAIEHLDESLLTFEKKISDRGAKVIWAEDAQQALEEIGRICREKNCKTLVKSKSMVTEELHLNKFLEEQGIESVETDLGEYIQQLDDEPPYHIVTPAMHKSKEQIADLFTEKLGVEKNLPPEALTLVARSVLREKFVEAQVGITGANFIVADTGSIALTENEGNARLSAAFPKTLIVVAGIEKVIPSLKDLELFWPLLATYGTGQLVTAYNSLLSGPKQDKESDGPTEMYVVLLDNGRTNLLENEKVREALYCIRCGACLNACPVYKNIGGHSYETTYSGPIGSVITPHLKGMKEFKHLSFASSLCGNCTEVCPVRINLHELLLENRAESVEEGYTDFSERAVWKIWKFATLRRGLYNQGTGKMKNSFVNTLFTPWKAYHGNLDFSNKTFNQMWKEREKGKK